jgi:hypothetical protein
MFIKFYIVFTVHLMTTKVVFFTPTYAHSLIILVIISPNYWTIRTQRSAHSIYRLSLYAKLNDTPNGMQDKSANNLNQS